MKPAKHALTVLASSDISTTGGNLAALQKSAIDQMALISRLESESAIRAIFVGLALHRIKASLKHGQFGPWIDKNIEQKKSQTNNYMRLAIAALEATKAGKAELVALPEDVASIDKNDRTARQFVEKLTKWVGDLSLNELLIKHEIKGVGLKTALTEQGNDAEELTPAQKLKQARENAWQEAWSATETLIQSLTAPEKIQLITDMKQIETLKGQLQEATKLADERLTALRKK